MDPILVVVALGSMFVVGYLAHERGRSQSRWVWTAAVIGPLAIPLLYLADAAAAVAFEKACKRARPSERPHQRAAANIVRAPRRQESAHVLRRETRERGERDPAAEVIAKESEELPYVAPIGLDRLWRHAPLGGEVGEPARHLAGNLGGGERKVRCRA